MATSIVNLDTENYVRINVKYGLFLLQADRDTVRIVMSDAKPSLGNTAFHKLAADDEPQQFGIVDTNIWALATTKHSRLIVTEVASSNRSDFFVEVARGHVPGHSVVHKFGHAIITSDPVPVTSALTFQTPTAPQTLEVLSSDAADNATGLGAHNVTIQGIGADWTVIEVNVPLDGITPVAVPVDFLRVNRCFVNDCGTYADQDTSSHVGVITLRGLGTTDPADVWAKIGNVPLPLAQSEIAAYTIPIGYRGYLIRKETFVNASKPSDFFFFVRDNADDVGLTIPGHYSGVRRLVQREVGVTGQMSTKHDIPKGPYVGPADIGYIAAYTGGVGGTAEVSAEFELLLIEDGY